MKTITISGLDGSGKSTQIKLLKNYLESRGKRVFCFHAVEFSIGNKIINFLKYPCYNCVRSNTSVASSDNNNYCCNNYNDKRKEKNISLVRANGFQIFLRKIALRIDIFRFKILVEKLKKQNCDYILSDRFFWDSEINIAYLEKMSIIGHRSSVIRKLFLPALNTARCILPIYLRVSPKTIMRRERVPDQGLQYLEDKKKLYDWYFENFSLAKIVDGERDKEEVFEEILKYTEGKK